MFECNSQMRNPNAYCVISIHASLMLMRSVVAAIDLDTTQTPKRSNSKIN